MSATRLKYALNRRWGPMSSPREVREECVARYEHGNGWLDALGWVDDEYSRLFRFAAEESYRADLAEDRAQLADMEFLTTQAAMPFRGFCVYTLFNGGGELLYVGQTGNAWSRIGSHAQKSWGREIDHVRVVRCASRAEALQLEARLIRDLNPRHNVALRWTTPTRMLSA